MPSVRLTSRPTAVLLGFVLLGVAAAFPLVMRGLDVPWTHVLRYTLTGILVAVALGRLFNLTCVFWQEPNPPRGDREFLPAVTFHPEGTWPWRLASFVWFLVLAAAAFLFVPPFGDVNLESAWGEAKVLAAHLDAVRPGDRAGLKREEARRESLKKGFPELAWRLRDAENAWTARTNEAIAALTARVKKAQDELHRLWEQDRYDDLAVSTERLWKEFQEEAAGLEQDSDLRNFCDYYRTVVLLGKRGSKANPPQAGRAQSPEKP
jgi:hypothetical protein